MKARRSTLLYENGTPLRDAWLTFAAEHVRAGLPSLSGALQAFNEAANESFSAALTGASVTIQSRVVIEEQMRSDLLDDLFNGQLVATGYRVASPASRWPTIIDPLAFDDDEPDWKYDSLKWRGQSFVFVRVTDPAQLPHTAPPKRKGRPGSADVINAAIERLKSTRSDFCGLDRAIAAQMIRDEVGVKNISGNGLSTKRLESYIRANCGLKRISN